MQVRARRERLFVLAALALICLIVRWPSFANPVVGYDEQFYLLVGDRMLHGAIPYVDIFDRKPIGLFLLYAGIRLLGGDGFLAYKLVSLGFLALTAFGIHQLASRLTGRFGAIAAAGFFIAWHNYMGGEGGQSPVFYDLFMVVAALLVVRAFDRPEPLFRLGCAAMLAIGLAIQVKYCVLFEGAFFGATLLWLGWRQGLGWGRLAGHAALWSATALAPTALALGIYAAMGHAQAFIFCNFQSVMAQGRNDLPMQLRDLAEIVAILLPLLILLGVGIRRRNLPLDTALGRFLAGWFVVSLAGLLLFWRFNSPHYAIPLLLPLCVLIAPVFEAPKQRPAVTVGLFFMALIMAQQVLLDHERHRGGAHEAALAVAAARGAPGCVFVYAGYPALYMLTHSCLPTRWPFPGSLNMRDERSPRAIGTDPAGEVRRIMASRPGVVFDEYPRSRFGNPDTRAALDRALMADYRLSACPSAGGQRLQLVYKRRDQGAPAAPPPGCPSIDLQSLS